MKQRILPFVLAATLLLSQALPAWAQSPYWFLYMGQSLLYPLTRGLMGSLYYGPYNANPLYSASYFMKRAASNAAQYPYVAPYYSPGSFGPYGYRNAGLPPNYNYGLTNADLQGQGQPQNQQSDQSLYSNNSAQAQPLHLPASPYYPPVGAGNVNQPIYSAPPAVSAAGNQAPVMAAGGQDVGLTAPVAAGSGSPVAQGFIDHLVSKYQGDMSKALSNSDTRSWARAMGVVEEGVNDGSYLPADRLEVIGRILKDNTLDPVSKIDTMRILLKKQGGN